MVTHEGMPAADSTEDDSLRDAAKEDTSNNLSGKIKLAVCLQLIPLPVTRLSLNKPNFLELQTIFQYIYKWLLAT